MAGFEGFLRVSLHVLSTLKSWVVGSFFFFFWKGKLQVLASEDAVGGSLARVRA